WKSLESGATSLNGLALLEAKISKDNAELKQAVDKAIERATESVRASVPSLSQTYSISLAIMFLDRLGDAADIPLIESLMVRLIAGQTRDGGWGYNCPTVSDAEVARLKTAMGNKNVLRGQLK